MYLHLLAPNDFGGAAKRELLLTVLALAPQPTAVPTELDVALDSGFGRAGTAYRTYRDRQIAWLVRFVVAWKALAPEARRAALADPWAFRGIADSIPINSAYSQRNVLLHLAFPDTFERIVSRRHKQLIIEGLAKDLPDPTGDEDRDLAVLRTALERRRGDHIDFYDRDIERRWRPRTSSGDGETELRGWLVRGANVHGRNLVSEWLTEGYCSLAYPDLGELPAGRTRSQIDAKLAERLPELTSKQRSIHVGVLNRFLNEMQPGDIVATVDGAKVYVGTITSAPMWTETPEHLSNRRRTVQWANANTPFARDQLPGSTRDRLSGQMTVSSLGSEVAEFASLTGIDPDLDPAEVTPEPPVNEPVVLPEPTAELADELLIDLDWLSETVDLLREKKQIILYGPPGTGKTYIAQELAQFLTEQTGGEHRLVQFHPSYAYEDFFEGFRPQRGATPGTVSFELEDGPLKLLVNEANKDVTRAYVLIIDEINRANLAKVFGELYFLLEYRSRSVQLQYSPTEDFRLPPNLYLIGTMNTADRSIALVDSAMRRRFSWQGLFPGETPVADMLRRWLHAYGLPADRADLLDALNERIADRDAAIGPSYLMNPRVGTEAGLARIWKHHIMPLLEERHIGENVDLHALYGLDTLRNGTTLRARTREKSVPEEEIGEPPA
ncbi:5-methylcytosine-specific restriction protein B [Umezawaea tangerina]|uniref:5-methylcytosine-specific restriction protein B n=1 Tax=Umezawaea tangerina TaxID=84725 RepID=A0A2T0SNX4_9PSEU|nr:5-methylcytosine-specific restriction protein B [Umezawaea tangerina]